jgi:PiT family inorganic phosphate transporter
MLMAFLLSLLVAHSCKHSSPVRAKKRFKRLQLVSSALFSVGHGLNDSQKVMGIIAVAMIATGAIDAVNDAPFRVPMACFAAISLGTMC